MQTFQKFRNIAQTCLREIALIDSSLLSPVTLTTSPGYVWIAESLNPTHVSLFYTIFSSDNSDYLTTYTMTIYYYVDYLSRGSKNLKTEN